jgi:parallel beta-helix repeat protein
LSEPTQPAAAVLTVSSSEGLLAAVQNAHSGDTIKLAAGNYGDISLYNIHFDGTVTISGSDFTAVGSGIGHLNSSTIAFTNNTFHNLESDGIFGGGSSHVVVSGNQFTEFHPLTGDHPDAVQFWGSITGAPGTDVTITDNVITRGAGDPIQGIFIEYTNGLNISGNAMTGTMTNGISLSGSNNAVVEDNLVQGSTDTGARIIVRDGSTNVTVTGNTITEPVVNLQQTGSLPNVSFVLSANTTVAQASVGDTSGLEAWLSQHGATTLAELTPAPAPLAAPDATPVAAAGSGGTIDLTVPSVDGLIQDEIAKQISTLFTNHQNWFIL